jgi:opacity protein-like surface antigen
MMIEHAPEQGAAGKTRKSKTMMRLSASASALVLLTSVAQAQCDASTVAGFGPFAFVDFGETSSGTVSAVQSLISVLNTNNTAFLTQTSAFVGAPANPAPGQPGGGVWARGIGGSVTTRTSGSYAYGASALNPAGGGNCRTTTSQDFAGVQVGADISRLNIDGYNMHFGVTAGYSESSVSSPTGTGRLGSEFQIPFMGVYAAVTRGGFFADAQARWDFYHARLNDPSNGIFDQGLNARSLSLTGNVGYQIPLGDNWFIEPSAGLVYSRANVDRFSLFGTLFLDASPGLSGPARVRINDFDSVLGRASLRVGRNFVVNNIALQPFFTASVFNEFAGRVRTNINTSFGELGDALGVPGLGIIDTTAVISSGRIGTYGQFAVGAAGQVLDTGWLGYVRGDVRVGDRVEGWGLSGGLRYQFSPGAVAASGIVRKGADPSPVVAALAPVNWNGFHVGGSIGGLRAESEQTLAFNAFGVGTGRVTPEAAGILAGGEVGYDFQFGSFVVGVAGNFHWSNARGSRACTAAVGLVYTCETEVDLLTTVTGRLGYALDRSLFYVKGGVAFADVTERLDANSGNQTVGGAVLPSFAANYASEGWTIGAGMEFALTNNVSAKAEYMHYELDRQRGRLPAAAVAASSAQHSGDLVLVGLNFRFNPLPAPAPAPVVVAAPAPVVRKR